MNDSEIRRQPGAIPHIVGETEAMGFGMISEAKVGSLLATLAASKPAGRFLELGTGTGHGTAWLLAGMDAASTLVTVDTDDAVVAVARRHLGHDSRVSFHVADGAQFLRSARQGQFDLIYADAWPGKFSHLDEALALLRPGGIYVIDDLLPQPNWPEGHAPKVPALIDDIERRPGFATVRLAWASGLMLVVRRAGPFARPDFSGEWALDRPASTLEGGAASVRSARLTIEHREPVFRCQGAFAFDTSTFEYTLERVTDGREIADDEQRASARWDGDTLVLLDETGTGDAAVTMSWRYELDESASRLMATERMRGAGRDQDNVWVFQRR